MGLCKSVEFLNFLPLQNKTTPQFATPLSPGCGHTLCMAPMEYDVLTIGTARRKYSLELLAHTFFLPS